MALRTRGEPTYDLVTGTKLVSSPTMQESGTWKYARRAAQYTIDDEGDPFFDAHREMYE